jgi:hypothetical protein
MKKIFIGFLFLLPFITIAQIKGDIVINWIEKTEINYGSHKINVPQFSGNSFEYDSTKKNIYYSHFLNNTSLTIGNSVDIINVLYEPILPSQIGDLDPKSIPNKLIATINTYLSRDTKQLFLVVSPIIKDTDGYKRILSFSYSIKSSSTKISQSYSKKTSVTSSALAKGDWYQFYIEKSGVYKISKSFLQQLGFNVNSIDPRKIKIYGNGGRMLPLLNSNDYPEDLLENAIEVIGESDGVFNNEDYIIFYAEGVDIWNEESKTNSNLYDTKSFYYVTANENFGKRIQTLNQPTGNSSLELNTFDDYQYLENIGRLGRQWFGESFEINQEQEFNFNFPNIDSTIPIKIAVNGVSVAYTNTSFKINANGQDIGSINFSPLNNGSNIVFNEGFLNTTFQGVENTKIKLVYDNNGVPGSNGYLDKIRLTAKRKLIGYGKQFHFQYNLSDSNIGIVKYTLSNASGISEIWDVTDLQNSSKIENINKEATFSFMAKLGEIRKYIAIDPLDYFTPLKTSKTKIANQNLKGEFNKNTIDYVIITPDLLRTQAEKLAEFHRNNLANKLNVKVITLESIYQEFSSGKQDIAAIRNCIKYIYNNPLDASKRVKYVNLFGDASYDYKNRITNNSNIVPIYHALSSNTLGESSYASDDFYGRMDNTDDNQFFGGIDIAVGRMLNNNINQASEMVNKIIEYHDVKSLGTWRNNIVMICDDSDKTSDASLQIRQNALTDKITTAKPFLNANKIILDSYVQEASAGGARYPKAKIDLFNAFEKGALVFNYLGHGGEDGLAGERLWEKSDGQNLNNQFKYPLFITITCDFSRFDNPKRPTAGEYAYWNPKGGAISMLTTTREIGQVNAENFNDKIAEYLFSYGDGENKNNSIAESLRLTKNKNPNSAVNVIFCVGDPALMLAIPKPKITLTKVNDVLLSGTTTIEPFKSLSKMKVSGEVTDENNTVLTSYNGEVSTIIFDKIISRTTLNNDGKSSKMPFSILGETVFRGNASVTNGKFEFNFVVPRDIRIPLDNGKISFYAKKNDSSDNQTGADLSIKIGGVNENAATDNIPPIVKLYMNDETFISGGITNESPFLLANLEDENGINTASGIGHDLIAVLDGDSSKTFILNEYYQTKIDDYTKGTIRFPLRNLTAGLHTISLKAWDVYNNPITAEIQFIVVGNETLTLTHVLNYPNPFVNFTEFWFTHNRPYEPLEVQVQVYTVTGKVVWSQNKIINTDGFLSKDITWDGKDDFGNKIGKGVYVYKLTVKSNLTNTKTEKFEKLVIL